MRTRKMERIKKAYSVRGKAVSQMTYVELAMLPEKNKLKFIIIFIH